ncbi:tetratricopeptide repeat protein [Acetobacter sicerae]|uniref:tetratricopeptide repeat protein n=1 Tax=Acetobacter sicerae TaxID=85325 RepID=UPI00156BC30E|nr:tetratricopeptide repeat protein [Acetobacter sicerae]NHN92744.1 tetratricopeptide repeat protein [Acetobacter sicerae]
MSRLSSFLDGAPEGTATTLAALACAESLTDAVALAIYQKVPVPGLSAEKFIAGFKYSGLTEPRNSEWNLLPALREELVGKKRLLPKATGEEIHKDLLALGQVEANRQRAGTEIPSYLFTEAGQAYHFAGTGAVQTALEHYSAASRGPFNGAQWLGAKLAAEQERNHVIPEGAVETTFLRALVMLREGHKRDAMPLFRRVATTNREMREVAISLHIIGNDNNRGQRREAERELHRSIEIDKKLGNEFGVAQTLHSLANLLGRQNGRFKEAEDAYRESIEILKKLGNEFGVSQTLHSLANLLSRQNGRFKEAESAYRESINLGKKLRNDNHMAQALRSYGLAIEQHSPDEALLLLQQSLEINRRHRKWEFVRRLERDIRNMEARTTSRLPPPPRQS